MMMKCRDYIFQLTSGQLDEAGAVQRSLPLAARPVRRAAPCPRCRKPREAALRSGKADEGKVMGERDAAV